MCPVNLWFFYLCVMKVQLQGILSRVSQAASCSACQYMTPSWLNVAHKLQPLTSALCLLLLKITIFFFFFHLRRPCPQQHSSSVIKKSAKLCQIKQMMVGPRCMHAGFTQESAFLRRKKSILGLKKRQVNSETFGEQLLSGSDVKKRSLCFEFRVAQFYAHS